MVRRAGAYVTWGCLRLGALCAVLSATSCLRAAPLDGQGLDNQAQWNAQIGDAPGNADPALDDSGWRRVRLQQIDGWRGGDQDTLWLRRQVVVPEAARGKSLVLHAGRMQAAAAFFLNGRQIGSCGSAEVVDDAVVKNIFLPPDLLHYGGRNCIAVRLTDRYRHFGYLSPIQIVDAESQHLALFVSKFLNVDIFIGLSLLALVLGLAYMWQWRLRRREVALLYFAVANLSIALYFAEMWLGDDLISRLLQLKLGKTGLMVFLACMCLFLTEYFGLHHGRGVRAPILVANGGFALAFVLVPTTPVEVFPVLNLSLVLVGLEMVFLLYLMVRSSLQRNIDAYPILGGGLIGVALSGHDIAYQLSGTMPVAWLQGVALMAVTLAIFLSLIARAARDQGALTRSARALQNKTAELGQTLQHLQELGGMVAGSRTVLERELDQADRFMKGLSGKTVRIAERVAGQVDAIVRIDASVGQLTEQADQGARSTAALKTGLLGLSRELEGVSGFVQKTDEAMRKVADAAADIAATVSSVAATTEQTASAALQTEASVRTVEHSARAAVELADRVSDKAQLGQQAVLATAEGMQRIARAFDTLEGAVASLGFQLETIGDFVAVIEEVARHTKLLSINASILSAQAGEHGKGFAVVAGQMQTLSERTNVLTAEISRIIAQVATERERTLQAMEEGRVSVQAGEDLAAHAGRAMAEIREHSVESHLHMAEIASATAEQVHGTRAIAEASSALADMGQQIRAATSMQQHNAREVTEQVSRVALAVDRVVGTMREEARSGSDTAELIASVHGMATTVRQVSEALRNSGRAIALDLDTVQRHAEQVVARSAEVRTAVLALGKQVDDLRHNL